MQFVLDEFESLIFQLNQPFDRMHSNSNLSFCKGRMPTAKRLWSISGICVLTILLILSGFGAYRGFTAFCTCSQPSLPIPPFVPIAPEVPALGFSLQRLPNDRSLQVLDYWTFKGLLRRVHPSFSNCFEKRVHCRLNQLNN